MILYKEEEKLAKSMKTNDPINMMHYPPQLNPIINKLHQLSLMHSPTTMMVFLVDTLKSFIQLNSDSDPNQNLPSL